MKQTLQLFAAAGAVGLASFGAHSLAEHAIREEKRLTCEPVEVSVYFGLGESQLNEFSESLLRTAMSSVDHCELSLVEVIGFADATGRSDVNLRISEQRAQAALAYIVEHGVEAESFEVGARGDEGAIQSNGQPAESRRRADVRFIPQVPTA